MKKEELTLVEQTQRDLLKYIASNNLNNSLLPKEQELCDQLGVSRVVIREALSRLRVMGIIETKRKKGTMVVTPPIFGVLKEIVSTGLLDKDTMRDLYQLRLMLEIGMADFVFLNKTDEQLDKLDRIIAREVELDELMAREQDDEACLKIAETLIEVDIKFHSTLYEMTGNKSLMDFQYLLRHIFMLYMPRLKRDYHTATIVSHVGLFNLLCNGTADSFRMAMRLHLKTQFENMEKILDKAQLNN